MKPLEFTLPWPPNTLSPNEHRHHMVAYSAKKKYRKACLIELMMQHRRPSFALPARIAIRLEFAPPFNRKFDKDNLVARMKAGIDGIAQWLECDDTIFDAPSVSFAPLYPGGSVRVRLCDADPDEETVRVHESDEV